MVVTSQSTNVWQPIGLAWSFLFAAERMQDLLNDPEITDPNMRITVTNTPTKV
jgi:hypothetical protein